MCLCVAWRWLLRSMTFMAALCSDQPLSSSSLVFLLVNKVSSLLERLGVLQWKKNRVFGSSCWPVSSIVCGLLGTSTRVSLSSSGRKENCWPENKLLRSTVTAYSFFLGTAAESGARGRKTSHPCPSICGRGTTHAHKPERHVTLVRSRSHSTTN